MTITVLFLSTRRCKTFRSIQISSKCNPVVGSSKIYTVFEVEAFESSVASFTLWASPPDKVVAC